MGRMQPSTTRFHKSSPSLIKQCHMQRSSAARSNLNVVAQCPAAQKPQDCSTHAIHSYTQAHTCGMESLNDVRLSMRESAMGTTIMSAPGSPVRWNEMELK